MVVMVDRRRLQKIGPEGPIDLLVVMSWSRGILSVVSLWVGLRGKVVVEACS